MPGGLLQLTVVGTQNKYLTGKPNMTYFKYGYCQHTNFACESINQTFDGTVDFGQKITTKISRHGDLVSNMILEINLPKLTNITEEKDGQTSVHRVNWVNGIGYRIIDYISIDIGGTEIDRHTGEFLYLQHELTLTNSKKKNQDLMVGLSDTFTFSDEDNFNEKRLYIPLKFWFTKEIGNSIPLVALQYHDVTVHVKFKSFHECVITEKMINYNYEFSNSNAEIDIVSVQACENLPEVQHIISAELFCDYIFLDKQERKWFAQTTHRFLIEQVQENSQSFSNSETYKFHLNFNHPCKELIWYSTLQDSNKNNDWLNFGRYQNELNVYKSSNKDDILKMITLYLNGHERLSTRSSDYYKLVHCNQYHTGFPRNNIYSFPFSLVPEKLQPSGSLNFSELDDVFFTFTTNSTESHTTNMYAINYNILIVTQGMGGLAYSN